MALPNVAPTYQYVGGESEDGLIVGRHSSIPLGFYGGTPVAKPALSATAAVATTAPSSTQAAFTLTSADTVALRDLANALRAALITLNLTST